MKIVLGVSMLSLAALSAPAGAQVLCVLAPTVTPYDPRADMPASTNAQADLKKVRVLLCPKGCGKVLIFANSTTPNTVTVTDGVGFSKIVYSPAFVNSVHTTFGPNAMLGILAHELGHHIESTANHASWMNASWDSEMRADAWAGCALARLELRPSVMQAALRAMETYPPATHAPWTSREPIVQAGYTQCGGGRMLSLASAVEAPARGGKNDATQATAATRGCSNDRDCRNGRTCLNGRCGLAPERRECGKDTDCPDPQECDQTGYCSSPEHETEEPPQSQQKEQPTDLPKVPKKQETELAPQERAAAAPAAKDPDSCGGSCDDARKQCVDAATGEFNRCVAPVQAEANYRACACPNYPKGNLACYRVCAEAYERVKSCWPDARVRQCKADGEHCRSQCP